MKFTIQGDTKFFEKFQVEYSKEMETALRDSVDQQQNKVREKIKEAGLINTGHLVGPGIQKSVTFTGSRGLGIVGTNAIYALPLELGVTKKFFPSKMMVASLIPWVIKKMGVSANEAKKVAWAVAWKIARRPGAKKAPYRFFEKGFKESLPLIAKIFEMHIKRASALTSSRTTK